MYYYVLYAILAFLLSFILAYLVFPRFIRKMKERKKTGPDVNKRNRPEVPEMGGIVCVFSFSLAMFVISGLASLLNVHEDIILPLQAAMTVFLAAATIGFVDDIGLLSRRMKAALIIFAAAPMVFLRPALPRIDLIFTSLNFSGYTPFGFDLLIVIFWLLVVPLGIMASANAINMAARLPTRVLKPVCRRHTGI